MAKFFVYGYKMPKNKYFLKLSNAKEYVRKKAKKERIMGLGYTIRQLNKDGTGVDYRYITSRDGKYSLRKVKESKFRKWNYKK